MSHFLQLPQGVSIEFYGEGKLGSLVREKAWEKTSLGHYDTWPETLKGYVHMILTLPTPAIIFWGEEQIQIYNDGYSHIMGPRHPKYLGETYKTCWPDTYPTIYPWMRRVLDYGEIVLVDKTQIPLTRKGFDEEAFFTFTFSPLSNDEGKIEGILQIVTEVTEVVIADRRLKTLESLMPTKMAEEPQDIISVLSRFQDDVAVAAFFSVDGSGKLQFSKEFGSEKDYFEPALRSFKFEKPIDIEEGMIAYPIKRTFLESPKGVLILGASKRLVFNQSYRTFFENVVRESANFLALEEEKISRKKVEEERDALHRFFMQAPVAICVQDGPEHRYTLTNEKYLELIGNKKDIIGKTVREALPELEGQPFYALLDNVYRTGEAFIGREAPLKITNAAGVGKDIFCNFVYKARRNHQGVIDGIVTVAMDVTDMVEARMKVEKLAEDLRASIVVRDDFLSIASHELRTPLTSLRLQSQIVDKLVKKDLFSAEKALKYTGQTEKQISRLERLIDDMLDVSRIRSGALTIKKEQVDLCHVVTDVVHRMESQFTALGAPIPVVKECATAMGHWDVLRIEQVIMNLLTNALKYGNGQQSTVTIEDLGEIVKVIVADQGMGISTDDQEMIFNRFARANSVKNTGGLGLGLFLTRQIVEAHGGRIFVESIPGIGSVFTVELPK